MSVVYNKKPFEGKKILYAVVDQANVQKKNILLFNKMRDITFAITTRINELTIGGVVKFFNTIDDAMVDGSEYDLVFVQSVGNFLKSNQILQHFENYVTSNPDFFIIAFTLDWDPETGEGWVECHHQMILINVATWKQLGSPEYGGWQTVTEELPNYSRSGENFHDKYTPYWMKGEPGTTVKTRMKQGWGFIKAAFSASVKIDNFTPEMRDCRLYVYPESDSNELYQAFLEKNIKMVNNLNQKKWIKSLNPTDTIWVYNSEHYYFDSPDKQCTTYFGPAAGFKYLDILKTNDNVKFVFYDFHQRSIDWIKELKETWDGNDFPKYMASKGDQYKPYYKYINGNIDSNQKLLFDDFEGEEEFKRLWNKFKNCEVEYIPCNLFDLDQVKILLTHTAGNKPFFYYSNIFATDYTVLNFTLDEVREYHKKFLGTIFSAYNKGITHGCNELGAWVDYNSKNFT